MSIGDLSESSPEANQCRILYEPTRDHLLTLHSWRFAKTTRALSQTGNQPHEWLYEYDYPNDCLRVHYILPYPPVQNGIAVPHEDYEPVPYEVATGASGSRTILTNDDEAYISYTKQVTDERLFDPLFVQALAWLIAIDLAIPMGGDSGQRYLDRAQKGFESTMSHAMSHSINEYEPGQPRMPANIRARHGVTVHDFYEYRRP